jgi:hypothetical protein
MGTLHANTVSTIAAQIMQNIGDKSTPDQLRAAYIEQSQIFSQPIVREQLYELYTKKMSLEAEYRELKAREQEIATREQRRTTMIFTGMSLFFTMQFGVSYYTIFEVEWLGWDLVEPCTYSITQGLSITGLWFLYRNRFAGIEYSELSDYLR